MSLSQNPTTTQYFRHCDLLASYFLTLAVPLAPKTAARLFRVTPELQSNVYAELVIASESARNQVLFLANSRRNMLDIGMARD